MRTIQTLPCCGAIILLSAILLSHNLVQGSPVDLGAYDVAPLEDDAKQDHAQDLSAIDDYAVAMDYGEHEEEDFINLLNRILWGPDLDDYDNFDEQGRQFSSSGWRGLMGQPMPAVLKKEGGIARSLYRGFTSSCYSLACRLGINRLASRLGRLVG